MLLRWNAAVLAAVAVSAALGVAGCSPERDATSSLTLPSPSGAHDLVPGRVASAVLAHVHPAAHPKEEAERKSH